MDDDDGELARIRARLAQELSKKFAETTEVVTLTDANFDATLDKGIVCVDFWAPWCGPCKAMTPAFVAAARELSGRATLGKLNVDDNPRTARRFDVRSIPTMIVFRRGRAVDTVVGALPQREIVERVRRWVSDS